MNIYDIDDEDNVPSELLDAVAQGKTIQCNTMIGWIDVDCPDEFRFGVVYRVKPDKETE